MLHIAIGTSTDDYTNILDAADSGATLNWVLPKAAAVGERIAIFDRRRGFVAHAVCASVPMKDMFRGRIVYRADIGNVTVLPVPVTLDRVRLQMPDWAWTSYPRTFTTINDELAARLWAIVNGAQAQFSQAYEPPSRDDLFTEGRRVEAISSRYERSARARDACLQCHGTVCAVCGFDFMAFYGPAFAWCITAHHLILVSSRGGEYQVDPVKDMRPVCANCHIVIHQRTPPFEIEEVKQMIRESAGDDFFDADDDS